MACIQDTAGLWQRLLSWPPAGLGRGRQEVMAALCIREQWRLGPNPNSLHFTGLVPAAQLGTVLGSPPQRLGRVSIYRSFIQAWMHSQRVNKRKAEGSNIYHRIWLFLGPSPNSLTVNIRLLLAVFPYWVTGARFSSGVRHLNSVIYVYLAKCQQISLLSFWSTEVCQCSQQSLERYSAPILNPARIYLVPGRHLPWSAV